METVSEPHVLHYPQVLQNAPRVYRLPPFACALWLCGHLGGTESPWHMRNAGPILKL